MIIIEESEFLGFFVMLCMITQVFKSGAKKIYIKKFCPKSRIQLD